MPPVILCVDDDPIALSFRLILLSIAGYEVLTATSIRSGQDSFNCNHVDLVITDHLLPDGTGAELTLWVKQIKPELPVMVLTASSDLPPGYAHADKLLSKGMGPENFLKEVKTLLSYADQGYRAFRKSCQCR